MRCPERYRLLNIIRIPVFTTHAFAISILNTLQLDGDKLPALEGNVMSQVLRTLARAPVQILNLVVQVQGSSPYNFDNNMAVLKL